MGCRARVRRYGPLLAASVLLVVACSRGPELPVLQRDLEQRIETGFAEGLFEIRTLQRTGSAPFNDTGRGGSGVFVYYDAELEFLRDYSLTSWRDLNLGTLAFAIGGREKGIEGFDSAGNRKGDVLQVHGRLSYRRVEDAWELIHDSPARVPGAAAEVPGSLEGSDPRAVLKRVRDLVARESYRQPGSRDALIVDELQRAASRIDLGMARMDARLTLGTARRPGTYNEFGVAFAEYASAHGLPMHAYPSEGSVENGTAVHTLLLDFALVQSDVAEILFDGWGEEGQPSQPDLRSLGSLWPEAVHVVTFEDSGILRLADLRGKKVAVGHPGSGSRFNAVRVASAAGLARDDLLEVRALGLRESIAELEAGNVDVLLATEAVPSPALQSLAQRRPDVRFVSVDREVVGRLSEQHFAYYPFTVPARTYPGQVEPVHTLGTAAVLVTNLLTPDEDVERVLELLLDGASELSRVFYRAGFISRETVRLGIAIPLHPAAERFYARQPDSGSGALP